MEETPSLHVLEKTREKKQNHHLNRWIYWILITGGSFSTIMGVFLTLSVLIAITQQNQVNYAKGLIVSLLLLIGGVILIIGTLIMDRMAPFESNPPLNDS
jgi:acyl-CoA synthetase (AMP-forming)/AMP-acid ligase II